MEHKEINQKLNKWVGTMDVDYLHPEFGIAYCFKWLVPKLDYVSLSIYGREKDSYAFVRKGSIESEARDKNPALALCEAILQVD